jgi:hypothetical protein
MIIRREQDKEYIIRTTVRRAPMFILNRFAIFGISTNILLLDNAAN